MSEFEIKKRQDKLRGKSDKNRIIFFEIGEKDLYKDFDQPEEITVFFRTDYQQAVRRSPYQIYLLRVSDIVEIFR